MTVESLESRQVMTAFWDGNSDGDGDGKSWHDPLNWRSDQCPVDAEAVEIGAWATPIEIDDTKLGLGNHKVGLVKCQADLKMKAGALSIGDNSLLTKSLIVAGGEIMLGAGTQIFGSVEFSNGTIINEGRTRIVGALNWSGGTVSGALGGDDQTNVRGGIHILPRKAGCQQPTLYAHTLVNFGHGDWSSAAHAVRLDGGATFAIANGATFDIYVTAGAVAPVFVNGPERANRLVNNGTLKMIGDTTGRPFAGRVRQQRERLRDRQCRNTAVVRQRLAQRQVRGGTIRHPSVRRKFSITP